MKRTNTAQWYDKQKHWQIKVQKNGVRKSFYSSTPGRAGQREANAKADAWLDEGLESTATKVSAVFDKYLVKVKEEKSHSAYVQTEKYYRLYIKPCIGTLKLSSLTDTDIQAVIDTAYKKRGLSAKTLKNLRSELSLFLKDCRKKHLTTLSTADIDIPKNAAAPNHTILQPTDLKTLFSESSIIKYNKEIQDPYIFAYRWAVVTGMRPGEICGLRWSDISDNFVEIKRSINVYGETTSGKNSNALRKFAVTPIAAHILESQKEYQREKKISTDYVFSNDAEPLPERRYYKSWLRYKEQHEIADASPYELRHTFVSAIKGLPEGLLKQLVGHSKDMDTYGVYSHEIDGDKELAAALVNDVFSKLLTG